MKLDEIIEQRKLNQRFSWQFEFNKKTFCTIVLQIMTGHDDNMQNMISYHIATSIVVWDTALWGWIKYSISKSHWNSPNLLNAGLSLLQSSLLCGLRIKYSFAWRRISKINHPQETNWRRWRVMLMAERAKLLIGPTHMHIYGSICRHEKKEKIKYTTFICLNFKLDKM